MLLIIDALMEIRWTVQIVFQFNLATPFDRIQSIVTGAICIVSIAIIASIYAGQKYP